MPPFFLAQNLDLCFSTTKRSKPPLAAATPESHSSAATDDAHSDILDEAAPDFAAAYASHRFFFSSPGRSNSIVDSSSSSSEPESPPSRSGVGVPVQTYSPDPYSDFRRSMEEMVAARELHDVSASWKSLHELLLCYLSLNPKTTHKFIVAAFSDLLVSLMSPPESEIDRRPEFHFPAGGAAVYGCSCD